MTLSHRLHHHHGPVHQRIIGSSLLLLLVIACFSKTALGMPYMILTNGGNKCIKIDVDSDMILLVDFHAPDLILDKEELFAKEEEARQRRTGSDGDEKMNFEEDGLDSAYEHRRKRKARLMPDLMVQMNHLLEDNGRRRSAGTNRSGTRKLRTDITEKHGQLEFYTGERDGFVELCVQAYMATRATPRRIALRIQKHYTEEHERREAAAEKKAQADAVKVPDSMQTDMLVKVETSRITTELERLAVRARDCGTVSRTAQKRDEEFHLTSMKLHRAVRWYPIFRVAILIVAGYLQASHVVRYMKNRHIY